MRNLKNVLLAVTTVVGLVPTMVLALPPPCSDICFDTTNCKQVCSIGFTVSTCGKAGYCPAPPLVTPEPTASVSRAESPQSEQSAPVCSEANPAAEQSAATRS